MSNILNVWHLKQSNDTLAFLKCFDKISAELRSLERLGLEMKSVPTVLCTTILKVLPQDILVEFNKLENGNCNAEIKVLLNFLSLSLRSSERALLMSHEFSTCGRLLYASSRVATHAAFGDLKNNKSVRDK
ncbi:hypothetical protein NPIL_402971 [Nephila pilipes]|uniref:Uncharacterized protein n=1 Tax=Nephila pilipes TaxID=299642 RepID=A0A8X6QL51_NEPPI|nr:hypothetical protein NPIL_402971 [Nephila pilipes]